MPQVQIDDPQVFGQKLAAGTALAEPQADGTIVVRDVPIFSEVRGTDPGVLEGMRKERDLVWLQKALAKTRARIAKGYLPPMTLRHGFDQPEAVGTFVPERIVLADVNPDEDPRATIMGTKVYSSRAEFEKAKDHPYRSVEVSPDDPDELSALALLREKAPFHKYPNLYERLAETAGKQVAEAFSAACDRAIVAPVLQVWQGRAETFEHACPMPMQDARHERGAHMSVGATATTFPGGGEKNAARDPYAIANAMLQKGEITKAKFDDVVSAIKRESHENKEGVMPADTKPDEKKEPSIDEKMAAMADKFMDHLTKHFEAKMKEKYGTEGEERTKAEGGTEKPGTPPSGKGEEEKKGAAKIKSGDAMGETHQSQGPNANLPPAVSQARTEVAPQIAEQFSQRLATQEQTILGLRGVVEKMQREKDAVAIVSAAKKTLTDMGAPLVSEAFEAAATKAAVAGGQSAVDALVESVKIGMGLAARAPEAYGAFGAAPPTGNAPLNAFEADVKKAVETFGARPEAKTKILELAGAFRAEGEHFVRSLGAGQFFKRCQGSPEINPAILEAFGGMPPARNGG